MNKRSTLPPRKKATIAALHGRKHGPGMDKIRNAKYQIGQVLRHRLYPFRGVVFDIDPVFDNTDEWYEAIPAEVRPHKDQPFYHLFAENDETEYIAYVSEQNLLPDHNGEPLRHPQVSEVFVKDGKGGYRRRRAVMH
jgi:heat shock protein HspQ